MSTEHVVVVGAGLVGAASALGLARRGWQVTLLERQAPAVQRGALGLDIRNVALNPQSRGLLEALDVWPQAEVAPYHAMQVWEQWGQSRLNFSAADVGAEYLGWLVEASPLQVALWEACAAPDSGVEVVLGEMQALTVDAAGVHLQAGALDVRADFLLAADGGRSAVREKLNLARREYPVAQTALATVVRCSDPHGNVARQRFLTDGPLALLPTPVADQVSVVWSQSADLATERAHCDAEEFNRQLTKVSEACLGDIVAVDQRLTFPLAQQTVAGLLADERVLLLGDAARVVHPLAGLGVNLGFEDVLMLFDIAAADYPLYGNPRWPEYIRRRHMRGRQLVALLHTLRRFYAQRGPLATLVRNTGVSALENMPALKAQLMREAMGRGPLSRVS
ncbi:MAG: FAD-dependent oxidoreductase [Pseudomonadota bacterium]